LIVLVMLVLLSLGAYTFTELMVSELEGTAMYGRGVETRVFADSGIEMIATVLGNPDELPDGNTYHNPDVFGGQLLRDRGTARGRGGFAVIAPVTNDDTASTVRYGLMNESSKLNINELAAADLDEEEARDALLNLPEMTTELADAILDWIDEDDELREFGAEADTYDGLGYQMKNGPLESLEELLLVTGVTPWLLFGEDANRNGLLDANEDDGEDTLPTDNADGTLALGWSAYLTVHSRESNLQADGSPRIHLNDGSLDELFDTLEEEFNEDVAQFIVAYRMYGPIESADEAVLEGDEAIRQVAQQVAKAVFSAGRSSGNTVSRGGMNLATGAQFKFNSIYDLVDAEVDAEVDGVSTTLASPWTSDAADMQEYLPDLMDRLSITDKEFLTGRVNINEARREVLLGIPGMDEDLADAIVSAQLIDADGEPLTDAIALRQTTGWLVMDGIVELQQMRELDEFLTARGDVYRAQVVGFFESGGPVSRLEVIVDATQQPPKAIFVRDLTQLGRGYDQRHLGVFAAQ
jgi:hypothetical protein